jgi:hypothetical protein
MGILQKTEDKIERFSLEVANQEMQKLRDEMMELGNTLARKVDHHELNVVNERCKDIRRELDAWNTKYEHDKDCIIGALENFSFLFLSITAKGDWTDEQRGMLGMAQSFVNELSTKNRYWYNDFTNRVGYV